MTSAGEDGPNGRARANHPLQQAGPLTGFAEFNGVPREHTAQSIPPAFLETVVQESLKLPAWVWREVFAKIREDDVAAELGKISVPTLVISGNRDGFAAPDMLEEPARDIPGARLVVYHGAGHALHWEEPARFAADLAAFTEGLECRG